MLQLAHVFQRQQVALVFQYASVGIQQIELHATELRTLATISRTLKAILRSIAQSAIANTKCAMNEHLQLNIGNLTVNLGNLVDRQFAG